MKKYTFLIKPVFYIFSLLFATWLVVKIEELSPSDFSGGKPDVVIKTNNSQEMTKRKIYLQKLLTSYKTGVIDSIQLDQKLTTFLETCPALSTK